MYIIRECESSAESERDNQRRSMRASLNFALDKLIHYKIWNMSARELNCYQHLTLISLWRASAPSSHAAQSDQTSILLAIRRKTGSLTTLSAAERVLLQIIIRGSLSLFRKSTLEFMLMLNNADRSNATH